MNSAFVRHVCIVSSRPRLPHAYRILAPHTFSLAAVQKACTMHRPVTVRPDARLGLFEESFS